MASQIKLEIDTGNGNTALAVNCGSIDSNYEPLLAIALGGQSIGDFHKQDAKSVANQLDNAINSLRFARGDYLGLTPVQQNLRPQLLDFVTRWRESCRAHPNCTTFIVP
jgi:hypothetical protein